MPATEPYGSTRDAERRQYFQDMYEKENQRAIQYEKERNHRREVLQGISDCLQQKERNIQDMMLQMKNENIQMLSVLQDRVDKEHRKAHDHSRMEQSQDRHVRRLEQAVQKAQEQLYVSEKTFNQEMYHHQMLLQEQVAKSEAMAQQYHREATVYQEETVKQAMQILKQGESELKQGEERLKQREKELAEKEEQFQAQQRVQATQKTSIMSPALQPADELEPKDDEAPFASRPEYEEDLGPSLELKMFSKVLTVSFVMLGAAFTSRISTKTMLAHACMRDAVGYPIQSRLLEFNELHRLAECAMVHPVDSVQRMQAVLEGCHLDQSSFVHTLQRCERFRTLDFTQFLTLLPFVCCTFPIFFLVLLVTHHDIPILHSRIVHIPSRVTGMLFPCLLVSTLYYVAQPLSNVVLLFRLYGFGELGYDVIPRFLLIVLFWAFLMELLAKVWYSSDSLSLFYLSPLFYTYPKDLNLGDKGVLEQFDPQEYENTNQRRAHRLVVVCALLFFIAVVVSSLYLPVEFLEVF